MQIRPRSPFGSVAVAAVLATVAIAPGSSAWAQTPAAAPPAATPTATTPANGKIKLVLKAQAGQTKKVKSTASLSFEAPGAGKINLEAKEVSKITYTEVAANGNITTENKTESSEMTMNGQKGPDNDDDKPSNFTIAPNGLIVAYKSGEAEPDKTNLSVRLAQATIVVFPDKEIGIGDKWTQEYKPNASIGSRNAKADFEVLAMEKLGEVECVKVKMTYAEAGEAPNIAAVSTNWVEKTSGDTVKQEAKLESVPFGEGAERVLAAGTVTEERVEGGPLPGSKSTGAKADKTIDEVVKEYEKLPGLLTLYRKQEPGSGGKVTIYAEIKEDQLNKMMMLQATASTGTSENVVAGDPLTDLVFHFVRSPDERIFLNVPNLKFRADSKKPIARAIERSYSDATLFTFKIEAKQFDRKSILIDISDLCRSDISGINTYMSGGGGGMFGGGGGFSPDREKTYVRSVKSFPENTLITVNHSFSKGIRSPFEVPSALGSYYGDGVNADPRNVNIVVNYNLSALNCDENGNPLNGYVPRVADPRVGYFLSKYQSYDVDGKSDPNVRYIMRWDLRKKDPSAKMSEPVKPIVFWLDNAIPLEYRQATSEGILMWNKAFEKLGFKNAVQVKQMPDKADFDHADMRYNVIRWVTSPGSGYAVANFRTNPLTGEIINASITVDANFTRYILLDRKDIVNPATAFDGIIHEDARKALAKRNKAAAAQNGDSHNHPTALFDAAHDPRRCNYGTQKLTQGWFGYQALSALAPSGLSMIDDKTYLNDYLREVISHEMGHIVGLRHNFVASTLHTPKDLKNAALVQKEGVTASVMDYGPFNVWALKQKGVPYYSRVTGLYDDWAVAYGYTTVPGTTPDAQKPALRKIAAQSGMRGHAYMSDEQADDFDPNVSRFDLAAEPLEFNARTMEVARHLMMTLGKRAPKKGESYYEFTRLFNGYLGNYVGAAAQTARYIGGLNMSKTFRGDTGEKPALAPIAVAKQKRALTLLNQYVFSPTAMAFPRDYYTKFASEPFDGSADEYSILNDLQGVQANLLRALFASGTLRRVANNEYKMGEQNALTLPTLFNSVALNVWNELKSGGNVPTLRRNLQRAHVDRLISIATEGNGAPEDARMIAWDQLRSLAASVPVAQARPGLDQYTTIHYRDTAAKIKRALNAQLTLGGGGGGGFDLFSLLMGAEAAKKQQR